MIAIHDSAEFFLFVNNKLLHNNLSLQTSRGRLLPLELSPAQRQVPRGFLLPPAFQCRFQGKSNATTPENLLYLITKNTFNFYAIMISDLPNWT